MNRRRYARLRDLLSQPTAPFRERHVAAWVTRALAAARVPYFFDPADNIVVGVSSPMEYRKLLRTASREPLRLFVAHMDHPGFHGVRWVTPRRLAVAWHGGSPTRHLAGAAVWLADDQGYVGEGRLAEIALHKSGKALARAEVRLSAPLPEAQSATDLFGAFSFGAPVRRRGACVYTKAADDLVGVFAIVDTAIELYRHRRRRVPFMGLLTRAEEVGFVGALAHFRLGWLSVARRRVVCVSLETSRQLPGARIGRGPVVRLGDRRTVFDPGALKVLADVAQRTLPAHHQRRVMDGGTCEATAATVHGVPAIGISVPLGNYHNEAFADGATARAARGPAPEFVHLRDVDGLLQLCHALLAPGLPWDTPWRDLGVRFDKNLRRHRRLLRRPIHAD
jgi:endoglucanase